MESDITFDTGYMEFDEKATKFQIFITEEKYKSIMKMIQVTTKEMDELGYVICEKSRR